jgi:hypothetical protein
MSSGLSGVGDQLKLQLPSWVNMMQIIGFSKDFFELVRDIGEAKSKEVGCMQSYREEVLTTFHRRRKGSLKMRLKSSKWPCHSQTNMYVNLK